MRLQRRLRVASASEPLPHLSKQLSHYILQPYLSYFLFPVLKTNLFHPHSSLHIQCIPLTLNNVSPLPLIPHRSSPFHFLLHQPTFPTLPPSPPFNSVYSQSHKLILPNLSFSNSQPPHVCALSCA